MSVEHETEFVHLESQFATVRAFQAAQGSGRLDAEMYFVSQVTGDHPQTDVLVGGSGRLVFDYVQRTGARRGGWAFGLAGPCRGTAAARLLGSGRLHVRCFLLARHRSLQNAKRDNNYQQQRIKTDGLNGVSHGRTQFNANNHGDTHLEIVSGSVIEQRFLAYEIVAKPCTNDGRPRQTYRVGWDVCCRACVADTEKEKRAKKAFSWCYGYQTHTQRHHISCYYLTAAAAAVIVVSDGHYRVKTIELLDSFKLFIYSIVFMYLIEIIQLSITGTKLSKLSTIEYQLNQVLDGYFWLL